MIHIGERIETVVRQKRYSVTWLARELCCNRQNIYDIFRRRSIDTLLLGRISRILEHDFFKDCSENMRHDGQHVSKDSGHSV